MLRLVFLRVLAMSASASAVIAVVLAARLALRWAPKAFSYVLWAVVLLRLLCPVSVEGSLSVLPRSEPPAALLAGAEEPAVPRETESGGTGEETLRRPGDWTWPGAWIWLAGAAGLLLRGAASWAALRRRLAGAARLRDNIYLTERVDTAFVLGLLRPRIYLPASLEERERPYVLLHEQLHIRRLDHAAKLAGYAALCVHWFNPLVWLAFSCFVRDMEMSCDEAVVRTLGPEVRADYAGSLLRLAAPEHAVAPLSFGEGSVKGRIRNLRRVRQPRRWVSLAAAALCALVMAACAVDPPRTLDRASGGVGRYAGMEDYAAETMAAARTVRYHTRHGQRVTGAVLDRKLARLTMLAEAEGVAPEGTLELWDFNYYVRVLGFPSPVGAESEHDGGWYDLEDPQGYLVAVLRYEDGSYDVLSRQRFGDGTAFAGRSYEEILRDCYAGRETE